MKILLFLFFVFPIVSEAKRMHLEITLSDAFPPFSIVEGDKISGPFPEIAHAICKRIHADCNLTVLPNIRAQTEVENGTVDAVLCMLKTKERDDKLYFTEDIVKTSYGLYSQEKMKFNYQSPKDLKGYSVVTYGPKSGTSIYSEKLTKGVDGVLLETVRNNAVLLRMLSNNRFSDKTLGILNSDVAQYIIASEKLAGLREVTKLDQIFYGIAMSRKKVSPKVFQAFNNGVKKLLADGTIRKILSKYKMETP